MTKIKFIFLFTLLVFFKSHACLNGESKMLKNGSYLYMDHDDRMPFGHHFFKDRLYETLFKLDSLYQKTNDVAYLSDKGLVLILQTKYQEALNIYLDIEKRHPNRYSTASNVGTIYELMGDNEKALVWIKKAVRINPLSHHESEWIHVKILEAKIKGEPFFTGKFLLDVDFGTDEKPTSDYSKPELNKLDAALYYQLNERISFIKPKDKIIAVLLFEMGNVKLLKKNYNDADQLFEKAQQYGLTNELIKKRLAYTNSFLKKDSRSQSGSIMQNKKAVSYPNTLALIFSIIIGLILVFFLVKKAKNHAS